MLLFALKNYFATKVGIWGHNYQNTEQVRKGKESTHRKVWSFSDSLDLQLE